MNAQSIARAMNLVGLVPCLRVWGGAALFAICLYAATEAADEEASDARRAAGAAGANHPGTARPALGIAHARQQDLYEDDLPAGAVQRLGTTRFRNRGRTESTAFSPDGRFLAAGGEAVRIFDATTGRLLRELGEHRPAGRIGSLAFSADGTLLATGGQDGQVRIYSIVDGDERLVGGFPGRVPVAVAFLPGDQTLVSFGGNGEVRLWDIAAGEQSRALEHGFGAQSYYGQLAVSRGGGLVAASSGNGIRIWHIAEGTLQANIAKAHDNAVTDLAFTAGGRKLLSCGTRRVVFGGDDPETRHSIALSQIRSWDVTTGKLERELRTDEPGSFLGLAASENRDVFVAATEKNAIYFNPSTGKVLRSVELPSVGKPGYRKTLAMSPDGSALAIATGESAVHVVDLETRMLRISLSDSHTAMVRAVAWSSDGNYIVTGSSDGTVRIWDALTSRPLQLLDYSDRCLNLFAVAVSPNGQYVAAAGNFSSVALSREVGAVKVWHVPTGRLLFDEESREAFFNCVFSNNGEMLAAARFTEDIFGAGPARPRGDIDLFRTESGERLLTLSEQTSTAVALRFTPGDESLISAASDGTIRRWTLPSGRLERTIGKRTNVPYVGSRSATISQSGTELVTEVRSIDRVKRVAVLTLTIWDLSAAEALHTLDGGSGFGAHVLDISSDGKLLVSRCQGDALTVWSMETGDKLLEFPSPQASIYAVAFDPSGRFVVAGLDDGTAVVWDVSKAQKIAFAEE